ncbi:MAG: AI-2E family transporter [Acidobacteria bacterium]|jgi:predicted PurR-regulated permease PerM|nr:AI-2E family transporter [Acidobacteriota bacterium]
MISDTNTSSQFVKRVLITVAIVAAFVLLFWTFIYVIDVILLLFGAILLAIFLHGLANISRRYLRLSEGFSVLLVSALLVGVISLSVWLLAPSIAEQVQHLRQELPGSAQKVSAFLSNYSWGRLVLEQMPTGAEALEKINNSNVLSRVTSYFSNTIEGLTNIALMLLLAIYLASEPKNYIKGFAKIFPPDNRKRVREILYKIGETLSWWLIGKGASMLFIGVLTWIGLSIIGVPLALTLGLIAGLFSFVPNFGPILSAVPAILLAFIDSPTSALYVLILFVVVQLIESNLLTPMIERRTVELPPVLTIVSQLALILLVGAVGLILATPILAVVMVLVQTLYIEDVLGDTETEVVKQPEEQKNKPEGSGIL